MRDIYKIKSVNELHQLFNLPKPKHPLVSLISLEQINFTHSSIWEKFTSELYFISSKNGVKGKLKYGQNEYDFDEGLLTFISPNQVMSLTNLEEINISGFTLVFHPNFLKNYPIANSITKYNFFQYASNEALFLSKIEENNIQQCLNLIEQELDTNIDQYSQNVIISQLELLLVYSDRYYNRQFITRKNINNDILSNFEMILNSYFEHDTLLSTPINYFSEQLNVSSKYLSDVLKSLTGLTTQQYFHEKLIEKAKVLLTTTNLSISEIAYQLSFEYPQSFHKLFKKKTGFSPLEYRNSIN